MSLYKTIHQLNEIEELQFLIDSELEENGGELTPEIEAKQKSIDGLFDNIIKSGADEIIKTIGIMSGNLETLDGMKRNIIAAHKSLGNLIDRFKFNAGALLAKDDFKSIKGLLGSISVRDKRVLTINDKDSVENKFKFVLLKFKKEEYLEKEFELSEVLAEVSKKDEINETLLKNSVQGTVDGAKVEIKKNIQVYKKRTKSEDKK